MIGHHLLADDEVEFLGNERFDDVPGQGRITGNGPATQDIS